MYSRWKIIGETITPSGKISVGLWYSRGMTLVLSILPFTSGLIQRTPVDSTSFHFLCEPQIKWFNTSYSQFRNPWVSVSRVRGGPSDDSGPLIGSMEKVPKEEYVGSVALLCKSLFKSVRLNLLNVLSSHRLPALTTVWKATKNFQFNTYSQYLHDRKR